MPPALPSEPAVPSSLNDRWIAGLTRGDVDLVRGLLAMGAHPFEQLSSDGTPPPGGLNGVLTKDRASLWGWAINAPTVDVLDAMAPVIEHDLRAAGNEGKAWMIRAWKTRQWGFAELFLAPTPNPDRLLWLVQRLEDWLVAAPGKWNDQAEAPWARPWHTFTTVQAMSSLRRHHPMEEFHQHMVLDEVQKAGNHAAWAIPVLTHRWGIPAVGIDLDFENERAPNLLMQALMGGQLDLAAALVRANVSPSWHRTVLSLATRMLYASVRPREEVLDDQDAGLSRLLGALLDANVPLTGTAPGLTWVPSSHGGERAEVERWSAPVPDDSSGNLSHAGRHLPVFKTATPVLDVLQRWFRMQDQQREKWSDPEAVNGIIEGIRALDYQALRQAWEARQLRDAAVLPVVRAPVTAPWVIPVGQAPSNAATVRPRARL